MVRTNDRGDRTGASLSNATDDRLYVTLPSGSEFEVDDDVTADFMEQLVAKYGAEFSFKSSSDLQDLDRVVMMEALVQRWAQDLMLADPQTDVKEIHKQMRELSGELRQLKKLLGIDKTTRDRARGEGSVPHFLASLLQRASAFGVMRSAQCAKAIELAMQLITLTTLYKNCDPDERRMLNIEEKDLIEWITDTFTPEFQAIDEHFRTTQQTTWIRDQ